MDTITKDPPLPPTITKKGMGGPRCDICGLEVNYFPNNIYDLTPMKPEFYEYNRFKKDGGRRVHFMCLVLERIEKGYAPNYRVPRKRLRR